MFCNWVYAERNIFLDNDTRDPIRHFFSSDPYESAQATQAWKGAPFRMVETLIYLSLL